MKDRYYHALLKNNGGCNEIELGEKMGLDEDETRRILAQLLSEYKIEHIENGYCEYHQLISRRAKPKNK